MHLRGHLPPRLLAPVHMIQDICGREAPQGNETEMFAAVVSYSRWKLNGACIGAKGPMSELEVATPILLQKCSTVYSGVSRFVVTVRVLSSHSLRYSDPGTSPFCNSWFHPFQNESQPKPRRVETGTTGADSATTKQCARLQTCCRDTLLYNTYAQ